MKTWRNFNSKHVKGIQMAEQKPVKRAITLGGGGPAAGLHIGALEALATKGIKFDVWALSCIGAWVGIVYNQWGDNENKVEKTYQFFKNGVFRDDESYKRFPINTVFGADKKFKRMDEGDLNRWVLNQAMAPNPLVRYLTSMMYLSNINGLSRINYPDSEFMKGIDFEALKGPGKPDIFHNAWNLDEQKLALFANRPMKVANEKYNYEGPIDARSLCACSALPFVEGTVEIDGVTYCEGALVDTVNFESLLEEHHNPPNDKLHEVWTFRIVDSKQIRKPENLHDALANLCQLFAATVGEDDVKLFKYHVKYDRPGTGKNGKNRKNGKRMEDWWNGTVVEVHVPGHINFKWNHSNLDNGRALGKAAALQAIERYEKEKGKSHPDEPLFINENPEQEEGWRAVRDKYYDYQKRAAVRPQAKIAL